MGCFPIFDKAKEKLKLAWRTITFQNPVSNSSSGSSSGDEPVSLKLNELRKFSYSELKNATRSFSNQEKIGEGGFGAVYRGLIKDKKLDKVQVAVKKLNVQGQQGHKEWLTEVTYLALVDHPNLVKLVGYCLEDDERGPECLLVYEFMPNKSLDDHIFRGRRGLSWNRRLEIALGTARALAYLHEEFKPQIIYRDLKASNILLDSNFNAKLSDFGLARQGPNIGDTHVSTAVVGTEGYRAPEYVQTGRLTSKSDVWSFGMVLLELLTGKRSVDRNRPRVERHLADWVKPYWKDARKLYKIIDPKLQGQCPEEEAKRVFDLCHSCISKFPKTRPKMSEVVHILAELVHPKDNSNEIDNEECEGSNSLKNDNSEVLSTVEESQHSSEYLSEGQVSDYSLTILQDSCNINRELQ